MFESSRHIEPGGGPGPRGEIVAGIILSVTFHGLIVAALVASVFFAPPPEEPEEPEMVEFEQVDLLALGEEPDPDQLPRLTGDEGAPPETPEPEVEPDIDDPSPQPEPEPQPEPDEPAEVDPERQRELERAQQQQEEERRRQERQRRMDEALGEFDSDGRGDESPEGSPDGLAEGTVTDADAANMMQTYHARLLGVIERHWEIPTVISDSQLEQLAGRVRVFVRLSEDGHIVEYDFRERSGHDQFDDSIERVMRTFKADEGGQTLPLPGEAEIRQAIQQQGLILSYWEHLER